MNFGINALPLKNKALSFLLITVAGLFFMELIPMPEMGPVIVLTTGLFLGTLIIFAFAPDDSAFLLKIFLLAFGIRIFLTFLFYILSFVFLKDEYYGTGFLFLHDGWCYSTQGWQISKFLEKGIKIDPRQFLLDPNMEHHSGNITKYDFFTGFIYSITGFSPLTLFFMNCVASSLASIFVYLIARDVFSKHAARIGCVLTLFWPSFIFWATQNLKEPFIALFLAILLWSILRLARERFPGYLLLSVVSAWLLFKVGAPYFALTASALLLVSLFLSAHYFIKDRLAAIAVLCIIAVFIFWASKDTILDAVVKKSSYNLRVYKDLFDFLNYNRNVRAYGNLKFFKGADISTFGRTAAFTPLGLFFVIFAPFPWQVNSVAQIIAIPETLVFYALIPFTIKGIIYAYKNKFAAGITLLSVICAILAFLALVEGNAGTIFRHRMPVFYLLLIFSAVGLTLGKKKDA